MRIEDMVVDRTVVKNLQSLGFVCDEYLSNSFYLYNFCSVLLNEEEKRFYSENDNYTYHALEKFRIKTVSAFNSVLETVNTSLKETLGKQYLSPDDLSSEKLEIYLEMYSEEKLIEEFKKIVESNKTEWYKINSSKELL